MDTPVDKPIEKIDPISEQDDSAVEEVVAKSDPEPITEAEVKVVEFGMLPYSSPVGGAGWALHVFSFPDSALAEKECSNLATKGFQSTTRVVQFKEKGRWYRIYLGSFKTKAEAKSARVPLMEKLGEDWANPVQF